MTVCPRCGAEVHPLGDCIALALRLGDRAAEARRALDNMRLALPSAIGTALTECRLDLPILARWLACHAGTCAPTTDTAA